MTSPIVRRRLSAELRRWRVRAGMTLSDVAGELDWSPAKLGHIETGIRKQLSVAEVAALLRVYGVTGQQREAILALARQARARAWWTDYEDVVSPAYVGNEAGAVAIGAYGGMVVPDLLQTPEYTVLLARGRGYDGRTAERMVTAYLNRQENLDRDSLVRYHALVEEEALQRITDPRTRHAQLRRMIELAEGNPRVTVQLLSTSLGPHPGAAGPFTVLEFEDEESLVFVDAPHGGSIVEAEAEVARCQRVWHRLTGMAGSRRDTVTVLRRMDLLT